ncbi:MAG: ATP-grasp domain-containing protein, partial [Planctomycetota bacterium]
GTLEQITFRLTALHQQFGDRVPMITPPRGLELAIDKFHTLAILDRLGFPTPPTRLAQSRDLAMAAFEELGQDCVVKPLFGGEGRGVMRVADKELAWYTFSSLEQLGAVIQVQKFIAPGGRDTRLLVIGDNVFGIRRQNDRSFRSNVAAGAKCTRIDLSKELVESAKTITRRFGLHFASVDLIDNEGGPALFLEVNAVPGWKGAQRVLDESIADCVVETLERLCEARDD